MGVRGHVQIKQPEYGKQRLSSWVQFQAIKLLRDHGVTFDCDPNFDDTWEIEVDDGLTKFVDWFASNPNCIFDEYLEDYLKDSEYGCELLALLREGMDAAAANNYGTIAIDWF